MVERLGGDVMKVVEYDFAILGGGCIGSAIFSRLSQSVLQRVALIDKGRKTLSATAHSGGMLRVFHESPEYVNLALENHQLIQALQNSGVLTEKNEVTGSLYFFNKNRYKDYQASLKRMAEAEYPFEVLSPANGRRRFPAFHWLEHECAIYEPLGSQRTPARFVQDLISSGSENGGDVFEDLEVTRISCHHGFYRIFSDELTMKSKTLVLAGGARLLPRFQDLGLNLPLQTKELSAFVVPKVPNAPAMPHYFDRETLDFGGFGQKDHAVLASPKSKRLVEPFWQGTAEKRKALDCYAPGRVGLLGEVAGWPGLYIATGWGGTGFKFALEVAERTVNLLTRSQTERSVSNDIL
jgi:glycine/D-amino acid oxidase-like deaminating enzyme